MVSPELDEKTSSPPITPVSIPLNERPCGLIRRSVPVCKSICLTAVTCPVPTPPPAHTVTYSFRLTTRHACPAGPVGSPQTPPPVPLPYLLTPLPPTPPVPPHPP